MGTWIILGFLSVATISCATYFFRHRGYSRWPTVPGTIETLIAIHSLGGSASAPLGFVFIVGMCPLANLPCPLKLCKINAVGGF